jgi:hypothetical protein
MMHWDREDEHLLRSLSLMRQKIIRRRRHLQAEITLLENRLDGIDSTERMLRTHNKAELVGNDTQQQPEGEIPMAPASWSLIARNYRLSDPDAEIGA